MWADIVGGATPLGVLARVLPRKRLYSHTEHACSGPGRKGTENGGSTRIDLRNVRCDWRAIASASAVRSNAWDAGVMELLLALKTNYGVIRFLVRHPSHLTRVPRWIRQRSSVTMELRLPWWPYDAIVVGRRGTR